MKVPVSSWEAETRPVVVHAVLHTVLLLCERLADPRGLLLP